jgi:hypothetical protein
MTDEESFNAAVSRRDSLLQNINDRLQDESYSTEQRNALMGYRNALLDLTDQKGFPTNTVWPQLPF